MDDYSDKPSFVLFRNHDATMENRKPQMTGTATIPGYELVPKTGSTVEVRLAGWTRESKSDGKKFLSGNVEIQEEKAAVTATVAVDDIPF